MFWCTKTGHKITTQEKHPVLHEEHDAEGTITSKLNCD